MMKIIFSCSPNVVSASIRQYVSLNWLPYKKAWRIPDLLPPRLRVHVESILSPVCVPVQQQFIITLEVYLLGTSNEANA